MMASSNESTENLHEGFEEGPSNEKAPFQPELPPNLEHCAGFPKEKWVTKFIFLYSKDGQKAI